MTYAEMQGKQLKLSLFLAVLFLVTMFAIPFLNQYLGDLMFAPVLGLPFAWLFVGIILHLEFWAIAIVYTTFSNRWEAELSNG